MTILEALRQVTTSIKTWVENNFFKKGETTADDFGVYVQANEPVDAVDGDIWIDTMNDPATIEIDSPVQSVNGKTGNIIITSDDVNADPSGTADNKVSDHNINTSAHNDIRLELESITNKINSFDETDPTVPSWAKASTKPTYTKSEVGLGNVDNVKQYSANNPPPYPVTSVNGKTGAVTISALPAVTTSDNGKVLMVVNGAWQVVDLNLSIDTNGVISV